VRQRVCQRARDAAREHAPCPLSAVLEQSAA
jgi:hypothetical protein